jgi:hypothetical protein
VKGTLRRRAGVGVRAMNARRPSTAALIALTALLGTLTGGCAKTACDKQVLYAAPAPDGAAIAFVYRRSCGTPPVPSTHVALVPFNGSLHDAPGNVLALPGEQAVKIAWRSPTQLVVTGFNNPVISKSTAVGAIRIEFPAATVP